MARLLKRHLRFWVRSFWGAVLFAVITLAVLVQLGRALFPVLNDYREFAEAQLSEQLGVQVRVGNIDARWKGLRPRITLSEVAVHNQRETVFAVDKVSAEISLLSTLRDWRLAFRKVTFHGLDATLLQNEEGQWWVQGLSRNPAAMDTSQTEPTFDDPLDIFLFGRRVEMNETRLDFVFRSGLVTEIAIPHIRLENDAAFHRLAASFSVDEDRQALSLVVEGHGDPRDELNFNARGYLRLQQFPSEKVLAAFGIASDVLVQQSEPHGLDPLNRNWREDGRVNLELWFQGTSSRGLTWQGRADVRGSPLQPPHGVRWPDSISADFEGRWQPHEGWQLQLANTQLWWPGLAVSPLTLQLRGRLGEATRLTVADLDLGQWIPVAAATGMLQGETLKVVQTLQPQGRLHSLELSRRPVAQGRFALRALVEDVSVQAWQGAPAVHGITGYLEASALGGQVQLSTHSGFILEFPKLYHQPLKFTEARGAIRWEVDLEEDTVGVSSGTVHLVNEAVAATGHFNLRLPLHQNPTREPEITLVIGVTEGAASLHKLLVPYTVPETLYAWLDRSVQDGQLNNTGFIYHGSLLKEPKISTRTIQLHTRIARGEVAFDPGWPALREASATLYLDNNNFTATELQGQLGEVQVKSGQVKLVRLADGKRGIRVQGRMQGDSRDARDLLQQSPLRDLGGAEVSSWRWRGPLQANVDLLVPVESGSTAGSQRVDLLFVDNSLTMPDLNLTFENVHGPLRYDSVKGLSSPGLSAQLWGQNLHLDLRSEVGASGRTLIGDFSGTLEVAQVQTWARRPELGFAEGVTPVTGELQVPLAATGKVRLTLNSSLEGVSLTAPEPLQKAAEDALPLTVVVENERAPAASGGRQSYAFGLADVAQLLVINQSGRLVSMDLAFGEPAEPAPGGLFRVRGQIAAADALAWRDALKRYQKWLEPEQGQSSPADQNPARERQSASRRTPPESSPAPELQVQLDLRFGQLQFGEAILADFGLTGSGRNEEWRIGLEHANVAGTVLWVGEQVPVKLDLTRVHLPGRPEALDAASGGEEGSKAPEAANFWDELDLQAVPAFDLQVQDLRRGSSALGHWAMKVRSTPNGLLAYDITGSSIGLNIRGRDKPGAELVWLRGAEGQTSYFSGVVEARDLAETFRQLQLDPALSSERARFDVDLQWPDAPPRVNLSQLLGVVKLEAERGVFARSGSVGDNPLVKLIGLLNFDTLARRLRLDFSDLSATGLGYETIDGTLLFDSGVIHVREPLRVATPSSDLQLVGDLNVVDETLDTQLIATLPLAGNLTVAAALTGGVPLAIGVYVAGKVFKSQVDKVSSLRYSVTGSWDDPDARLEKIFENSVAKPAVKRSEEPAAVSPGGEDAF